MIFVSAIHLAEIDHLRGYEMGAVDYVPVPVVPEVLRAKVRVFTDLYRKNGISVILDVVYNHTGEGDHMGPVLSLKGLAHVGY